MGTFLREQDRAALGIVPAAAVPPNTVRPLTAAAARIRIDDKLEAERIKKRRTGSTWQGEAWAYFDMIGEVKYAFMLAGAVLSRIKLYVGHADTPSTQPSRLHDVPGLPLDYLETAEKHFQRLDTGFGGIPGLLREACINLSVPGECYLVQEKAKPASGIPEKWTIRSVDEVEIGTDGKASMRTSAAAGNQALEPLQEGSFIGRIWRPHPRYHDEADSSMRSLLTLCAELLLLNRTVRATAKSRLNAGALFIPDGLSVAAAPDTVDDQGTVDTDDDDTFEQELLAAMTLPIQDEDSASAVVPLLIRGPAELGSQIRPIKFERSFDAALAERADKVLDRILQGLDIPKDVVTGLSNVKYSNAVVIQESLYRTHIEPLALLICDALTMMFMRPAMASLGFPEETVNRTIIWYDPTDILTSADRAQNSDSGYDKFLLSGATWRAAHGFAETDAPTGEELLNRIVVSRGQVSPELTEAVLSRIAPDSFAEAREAALAGKSTEFPDSLENLLETGRLPEPPEGEEPLPPEILEGLPIPSPTPPDAEQPAGVGTGDAPPPPGTEDADAGKPAI
jgi:hypothetical protein